MSEIGEPILRITERAGTAPDESPRFKGDDEDDSENRGYVIVATFELHRHRPRLTSGFRIEVYSTGGLSTQEYLDLQESDDAVVRKVTDRELAELLLGEKLDLETVKAEVIPGDADE